MTGTAVTGDAPNADIAVDIDTEAYRDVLEATVDAFVDQVRERS